MTTDQLEHLRLIDEHLTKLLDLAAKRTPGEWKEGHSIVGDGISSTICSAPLPIETLGKNWLSNRLFIASCAGNAEAGWRSTLATIDWAVFMHQNGQVGEGLLESILVAWPLESLKL
jgi:hypothetical protein